MTHYNDITDMPCGANVSYVLNDADSFSPTEYKVLQSQTNGPFVKCMKMLYNGAPQLYYLTQGSVSLSSTINTLESDTAAAIVSNLLTCFAEVENNGFLSCRNVDVSLDRIYLDPITYKVKLIYLPLKNRLFDDRASVEEKLRSELSSTLNEISSFASSRVKHLCSELLDRSLSFEELCERVMQIKEDLIRPISTDRPADDVLIRLTSTDPSVCAEIAVDKEIFTIGRKQGAVDAVISFNNMIGRIHCRIEYNGEFYTVTDLQSTNGTFVNKVRLQPNSPYTIKNGDILRLANSDFLVTVVKGGR